MSENDRMVSFTRRRLPFFRILSTVFTGSLLVALKRAILLVIR